MPSVRQVLLRARRKHGRKLLVQYGQVPFGLCLLLLYAWGADLVIQQLPFSFPAPVICMIIFFLLLIVLDAVAPKRALAPVIKVMKPSCDWVLLNMGLFFTPSFVLIPSRPLLPGRQIGLITAVFAFTMVMCLVLNVAACKLAVRVFIKGGDSTAGRVERSGCDDPEMGSAPADAEGKPEVTAPEPAARRFGRRSRADSETTLVRFWTRASSFGGLSMSRTPTLSVSRTPTLSVSRTPTLSVSRTPTMTAPRTPMATAPRTAGRTARPKSAGEQTIVECEPASTEIEAEKKGQGASTSAQPKGLSPLEEKLPQPSTATSDPIERYADILIKWIDPLVYFFLAFPVGLPMFYPPSGNPRSLPLFLGVTVLAWLLSTRLVPPAAKRWAHPILTTSFISLMACWGFGAIKGQSIKTTLRYYATSNTYIKLFKPQAAFQGAPGAGDVLSSILDSGIVALALPLFQYRQDLYRNALALGCIIVPNCVLSLFFWPYLAGAIGVAAPQALAFAGRFMSTPLAIELVEMTGGDQGLTVVLVCVTGIVTVILKDHLFRLMRVKVGGDGDDYFVQGVTVGVIAGAIGTSSFANVHPRAMATSTISFAMFGLILLVCTAVPVIADYVAKVAGG